MLAIEGGLLTALGNRSGLYARLVHQPDPGLHSESAIVPLDHADEPAVERVAGSSFYIAGHRPR